MRLTRSFLIFLTLALLGGCATMPTGPSVAVLPGPGKPFEVFKADDYACRQWALQQIGGASPNQTGNENLATGAALGTLLGAGIGAAIGSTSGQMGAGAAIGAAAGLLAGTSMASGPASASRYQLQRRYDIAYQQCMYAKGNQIPGTRAVRAYGPPPPPPGPTASGSWVTIPGQSVNGVWVPEHRVQVPSGSGQQAPPPSP